MKDYSTTCILTIPWINVARVTEQSRNFLQILQRATVESLWQVFVKNSLRIEIFIHAYLLMLNYCWRKSGATFVREGHKGTAARHFTVCGLNSLAFIRVFRSIWKEEEGAWGLIRPSVSRCWRFEWRCGPEKEQNMQGSARRQVPPQGSCSALLSRSAINLRPQTIKHPLIPNYWWCPSCLLFSTKVHAN